MKSRKFTACTIFLALTLAACTAGTPDAQEAPPDPPADAASDLIINAPAETPQLVPEDTPEEIVEEPLIYIALGDSVSAGYGARSLDEMHTSIFFELLKNDGHANEYVNMAVNGLTTSALLSLLDASDEHDLVIFQNASVITLNIGGNNILLPFIRHMPDPEEMDKMISEAMSFVLEAESLLREIVSFVTESQDTIIEVSDIATDIKGIADNLRFSDIFRIHDIIRRASAVLGDTIEVIDAVTGFETAVVDILDRAADLELLSAISLFLGSFPPELENELEKEVQSFSDDFAQIISWLEDNAPNAAIIVNTVYNPVPAHVFGLPLNLSGRANDLVQSINEVIHKESSSGRYIVSDVYSIMSDRLDMMNVSLDIIHPNPAGHGLIAHQNYDDYLSR